jgi:hypothetical protein
MKTAVFLDVTPCCSYSRRFGGTPRLHHQVGSVLQLLVTADVHSLLSLFALMM